MHKGLSGAERNKPADRCAAYTVTWTPGRNVNWTRFWFKAPSKTSESCRDTRGDKTKNVTAEKGHCQDHQTSQTVSFIFASDSSFVKRHFRRPDQSLHTFIQFVRLRNNRVQRSLALHRHFRRCSGLHVLPSNFMSNCHNTEGRQKMQVHHKQKKRKKIDKSYRRSYRQFPVWSWNVSKPSARLIWGGQGIKKLLRAENTTLTYFQLTKIWRTSNTEKH